MAGAASEALTALRPRLEGELVSLRELAEHFGDRAPALLLLVLALPEAVPLPIAGVSAILAVPIMAIAVQLVLGGGRLGLPPWVARRGLPTAWLRVAIDRGVPILRRAERWIGPRLGALGGATRLAGAATLVMGFILFLPIPFGNVPPAIAIVLLALGLIQRDGVLVLAGLVTSAAVVIGLAALVWLGADLLLGWLAPAPG
jgi:hypothetical protein